MARFSKQLDGARDYVLYLDVNVTSQNVANNTSTLSWRLWVDDVKNWGSFKNDPTPWSVNIGGATASGNLPSFPAGSFTVASGSVTREHASNGTLTITASGTWNSHHSNVGKGTASGSMTLPTINRLPFAPTVIGIDQETTSGFRYRFSGSGGGAATSWQIEYAQNSSFTGSTLATSSGTSVLTGLTAGATYWIRSRGVNALGNGPWSAVTSVTLPLSAPTFASWAQNAAGALVATWSAPAHTTGLIGYRLQVAQDAAFTVGVQNIDVGNVLSRAVTGLLGGRAYYARVAARTAAQLGAYSAARSRVLVLSAGDIDGWTRVGAKPATVSYFTAEGLRRGTVSGRQSLILETLSTGAATLAADTFGIQRIITGLTVGKAYRFQASAVLTGAPVARTYRLRVVSEASAEPVTVTSAVTDLGHIEFVADATTATLQILLAEPIAVVGAVEAVERVAFSRVQLLELATDYPVRLRETVYESNLANHFDLACNSVGASWYVGKDGVTRFRLPGAALPVSTVFTDEINDAALHYIDVAAAYDTRGMVNRLDVTNYGVDDERTNEQNDELIVTSAASIAAYGVRSSRLETNLHSLPPYDETLAQRLNALLDDSDEPRLLISSFRWNAQENLPAANALDVGQRILVRFNGTEQDSQIVNLHHDITPRRWIVTVTLRSL